jgi:siderophore synthetase component
MTTLLTPDSTALAAAVAEEALGHRRPDLVAGFRRQLPRAMDVIARRLVAAAYREGLVGDAVTWADGRATLPAAPGGRQRVAADRHAFARLEFTGPVAGDPADLFERLLPKAGREVRDEITDAAVNLALALARRDEMERDLAAEATRLGAADLLDLWAGSDSDERTVHFERLATEGHNLHPCGRTRLGWRVEDLLAHDLESPVTSVGFVGVRRDLHVGDEIGPELLTERPQVDPDRYAVTPVHPWQMRHLTRGSYTDLVGDGSVVPLDVELPALVSAALRTLLLPGRQRFVKVSLDIQVTSTRRTISVASTRNGPALSRVLPDLIDSDRVLLMAETAGSAAVAPGTPPRNRDLAAILRNGLSGRLEADEIAVPGSALYATSPLSGTSVVAELVARFGRTRHIDTADRAALAFVGEYARLLLPPVLSLATRFGIGLEAHLQNCVPTFVAGVPQRLGLRDLAGMRIHLPRLGPQVAVGLHLWPGSVIVTDELEVMQSKVAYTAIQAHLGEIVLQLVRSHGMDEEQAWAVIRSIVDETYEALVRDDTVAARAREDHTFLTAATVPHKALLLMRLRAVQGRAGDSYVRVENPLR